ncbi:MAG: hypothetical protein PHI11_04350 [Gallionella sp.]|nr:hypothetical protein [Gallionella sp.]
MTTPLTSEQRELCQANKTVSDKLSRFLSNVPDVKEESVTDYLMWKWRELDVKFNYLNVSSFTRYVENKETGADFEMELWLVGDEFSFPIVFQAKKLKHSRGAHKGKLNYPKGTQAQLSMLLSYARSNKRIPFYIFYTPEEIYKTQCCRNFGCREAFEVENRQGQKTQPWQHQKSGMFIMDAHTVKKFADGEIKNRDLLQLCTPFFCIFCCNEREYFFEQLINKPPFDAAKYPTALLPKYVKMLLTERYSYSPEELSAIKNDRREEQLKQDITSVIEENQLRKFHIVSVYDMRSEQSTLKLGHQLASANEIPHPNDLTHVEYDKGKWKT